MNVQYLAVMSKSEADISKISNPLDIHPQKLSAPIYKRVNAPALKVASEICWTNQVEQVLLAVAYAS